MSDIALIQNLTPAIFTEKGGLDKLIEDIKKRVANFNADASTAIGRDEIKSFAFKIAKSKTALDNLGKDCVADWKAKSKLVDAERSRVWEVMEALQHQVRKPVTDWEQIEESRISALKERIQMLTIPTVLSNDSTELKSLLSDIKLIIIDESFEEMAKVATITKDGTVVYLEKQITAAEKREADAAELLKLREEAEKRAQHDRDEAIRKEAAEKATKEAEGKAQAEREAIEKREMEIKQEAERKEQEAKVAAEKAAQEAQVKIQAAKDAAALLIKTEREAAEHKELELKLAAETAQREKVEAEQRAVQAVEEERKRVAEEQVKIAAEQTARDANLKHKKSINIKIRDALILLDCNLRIEQAEAIIKAIVADKVPHTKITY